MENNLPLHLQDIIFGSADKSVSRRISLAEKAGEIKKIAPRLYTGKLDKTPEELIRANIYQILGTQYPGAVLSHRSALEFAPTESGSLFLTNTYTKKIELPGITLRMLEGPPPIAGDNKFRGELYVSQEARAYLENMQVARREGGDSKILPMAVIEEKLDRKIRVHGEAAMGVLRDKAREIAPALGMEKEFEKLNKLIASLLTTHAKGLVSASARARAIGVPFDSDRLQLFELFFAKLQQLDFTRRPERNTTAQSFTHFAFYESYFSNYIEGTKFSIEEAKEIIATGRPMAARNEDSHDILGTFQLVSSHLEMTTTPADGAHLLDILTYRHRVLLSARKDKHPGQFKEKANYAGDTKFVDPGLLRGTLLKGFDYYNQLSQPFSRAIFMMFMVSETHPFEDGNGRIARVMMNAELVKAGESKIMIPNVFRDDYIGALRRLTRKSEPDPFIGMMSRAHEFSVNVYGDNRDEMENYLRACNAFYEDTEGKILQIVPRQ
jgi:fido (protein-threonine AMPylation protein)